MALPNDENIQTELLRLLSTAPEGRMHCRDAYRILATEFPRLTKQELQDPYVSSLGHWANRVQFARLHLVEKGWVHRPPLVAAVVIGQSHQRDGKPLPISKLSAKVCSRISRPWVVNNRWSAL
jgi:hypothetical protein